MKQFRNAMRLRVAFAILCIAPLMSGCNSPYRSDRGALLGGLGGAGVGAIVGNAVGNTGAGAAIGAGVGALSGAAVGGSLDEIEARNRAEIDARLGPQFAVGTVTNDDVIAMTRSGVPEEVIINHVRSHGMAAPPQSNDLILLTQQHVSPRVIQTMQAPPALHAGPPVVMQPGPPVIVAEPWYPPPYYYGWGPPYYRYRRPGMHWGVGFGN